MGFKFKIRRVGPWALFCDIQTQADTKAGKYSSVSFILVTNIDNILREKTHLQYISGPLNQQKIQKKEEKGENETETPPLQSKKLPHSISFFMTTLSYTKL